MRKFFYLIISLIFFSSFGLMGKLFAKNKGGTYMIKTVKIGEIKTEMVGDINKTDVMNVFLRIGWGAETTSRIAFKPTEDLKAGDGIQVTIEKMYEEPELNEEKEAATGEVTEASAPWFAGRGCCCFRPEGAGGFSRGWRTRASGTGNPR